MMLINVLSNRSHRMTAFVLFLISFLALGIAYLFEFFGGIKPCALCIYQRFPHMIIIGLCIIGILFVKKEKPAAIITGISALLFFIGAGIASFHVGVEHHWWQGTTGCGAELKGTSIEALRSQLLKIPITRCDEVSWSLFGLSLAGYNAIISIAAGGFSVLRAYRFIKYGTKNE